MIRIKNKKDEDFIPFLHNTDVVYKNYFYGNNNNNSTNQIHNNFYNNNNNFFQSKNKSTEKNKI